VISNKTSSAVRSAINAIQRYKVLNTLTHDCFEKALETEQQQLSTDKKSKAISHVHLINYLFLIYRQFSIVWSSNFNKR
jgi:hypothetical protein